MSVRPVLPRQAPPAPRSRSEAAAAPGFLDALTPGPDKNADAVALGFGATGVFGRNDAGETVSIAPSPVRAPDIALPSLAAATETERAPARLGQGSGMSAPAPAAPEPAPVVSGRLGAVDGDLVQAPHNPLSAPLLHAPPTRQNEIGKAARTSRAGDASTFAKPARLSGLSVAIHATASGLRVLARVGRMTETERERLRHTIKALLAEHGVLSAEIEIAGSIEGNGHG
jgi:hypothetical protein